VGLPSWMASKMFEDFGLFPESNTLDDFVTTAKAIEQRRKTKTYYEAMKHNMQSNPSTTMATPKPAPPSCQPTVAHNVGQHSTPTRLARFSRPPPRTMNNKAKPTGQNDPPCDDHRKLDQDSKEAHPPRRQAMAEDTCFNCRKKGHFSHSCTNPLKPKRDFIQAARSTMTGEDDESPDDKEY